MAHWWLTLEATWLENRFTSGSLVAHARSGPAGEWAQEWINFAGLWPQPLVDEVRSVRDGLRAVAILNCADPGETSTDNAEAAAAVADVPQFEYLDTPIRRRKAFSNAAGQGLSVLELKPTDGKAVNELNALVKALF